MRRLESIVGRIAKDNPDAAERFGLRLVDQAELLSDFPELGRPYPKRNGVRVMVCRPFLIFYRLNSSARKVEILDFWHGARRDPDFS